MSDWKVEYQDKNKNEDEIVIADAIQPFEHGVAFSAFVTSIQSMVTIAIRFGVQKVTIVVPKVVQNSQ